MLSFQNWMELEMFWWYSEDSGGNVSNYYSPHAIESKSSLLDVIFSTQLKLRGKRVGSFCSATSVTDYLSGVIFWEHILDLCFSKVEQPCGIELLTSISTPRYRTHWGRKMHNIVKKKMFNDIVLINTSTEHWNEQPATTYKVSEECLWP